MEGIINVDRVGMFGLEMQHPLVGAADLRQTTRFPTRFCIWNGVYAVFLIQTQCGDIRYGRQTYDYQEETVMNFSPGQTSLTEVPDSVKPIARGVIFHPDLIWGTSLVLEICYYSFFSNLSNEALHFSEEEKGIFIDCLDKISIELHIP